jgi:hypothetical protein
VTPVHCNEIVSTLWRRLFRCLVVTGLRADRSLVRLPARGIDTSPLETPKRTGEPTQPPVHRVLRPLKWVKVKITLEQATNTRRGSDIYLYSFFNLGAGCGWVIDVTPWPLYPRERPGTHCIGGWVGPRPGLDGCGKCRPDRDSTPGPSSP